MTASAPALYDLDPASLTPEQRVDALVESERELARLSARQQRIIAAISDEPFTGEPAPALDKQYFTEQLRVSLGESAESINNRVLLAGDLVHRLPQSLAALEAGTITARQAWRLADQLRPLPDPAAGKVEEAVLEYMAQRRDHGGFCRKLKREVLKHDVRGAQERAATAHADRRVSVRPVEDGMSCLSAVLPAPDGLAVDAALDLLAAQAKQADPGDGRTKVQRRADALGQLARDVLAGTCAHCTGAPAPLRPAVQVTVAMSTLLGIDQQPGELTGYGPIPAQFAVSLAFDASGTWRRLVTDPLGQLVDYGRTVYAPPVALREYVIARDRTCRFPGCNRRADACEIDHVRAWADGGETNADNLAPLCVRNHHCKHEAGWHAHRHRDGTTDWTDPTGHHHSVPPATYPIDHTLDGIDVPNDNDRRPPRAEHENGDAGDGKSDGRSDSDCSG